MKFSLRPVLALLCALLLLAGLSRWLNHPATDTGAMPTTDRVFQLTGIRVIVPPANLFGEIWTARSSQPAEASMTFDRFPRGRPLAIALSGQVRQPVRLTWAGGSLDVSLHDGGWLEIPLAVWSGKNCGPLHIQATLTGPQDVIRVSRPYYTDITHGPTLHLLGRTGTLGLAFLWITLLVTAASAWLQRKWPDLPAYLLPILGCAAVALCGYGLYWCYFIHWILGDIAAVMLGLAALIRWACDDRITAFWRDATWTRTWLAMLAVGLFYFALLHAWNTDASWSWLAANRYGSSPGDNLLPGMYADRMVRGVDSRLIDTDWLSSDRPPMQSGWILLLGPWLHPGGGPFDATSQAMGLWFQLLWVPALAAFFRRLGLGLRDTLLLVFLAALHGVLFIHSIYVWPKLSAAAFSLAGWVLLRGRLDEDTPERDIVITGLCLVIGFLCHGAAAFALLAIGPMWFWPRRRFPWKNLALCAFVAGVVYAPWWAYQHFYQPPANRLIKWHLAGVTEIDSRGSWEAIREAYRQKTWAELADTRFAYLRFALFEGDWRCLTNFLTTNPAAARVGDFFNLLRAVGWLNAGLLVLPLSLWLARRRRPSGISSEAVSFVNRSVLWFVLSYVVWWLLEVGPWAPYLHVIPFSVPLVMIGLGLWSLLMLHRTALAVIGTASCLYFCFVYGLSTTSEFPAHPVWFALLPLLLALALVGRLLRDDPA